MAIRKGYCDGPEGQIHWRMAEPREPPTKPDLYCFSPAPFSSLAYATILPLLAERRRVIAPDYPGQGGSDGGAPDASIEVYTRSMVSTIEQLSGADQVSLLGFHSGCLVAAEVKRQASHLIDHTVMIDVPAFPPEIRATYLAAVGQPFAPTGALTSVEKAWDMAVTKRLATQDIDECYALFADMIANGRRMNATFHAAFTYDVEACFKQLNDHITVLATQSGLLEPSRRAATLIEGCTLVERLDIQGSVLNQNASATADAVLASIA